jgi:hypothetical protein
MNEKLSSQLKAALKNQSDLQISEEHLAQTIQMVRIAYQNRCQRERIRYPAFFLSQVKYVGTPVWLLQGFLLLGTCYVLGLMCKGHILELAAHHLPTILCCFAVLVSMTGISVVGRSVRHRMLEVEMTVRISLPCLYLTRILVVGIGDLLLLGTVLLLENIKTELGIESITVYLLLPYLITSSGCLIIQAPENGRHQYYDCATFGVLIIAAILILHEAFPQIYNQANIGIWSALCIACAVLLIAVIFRLLRKVASYDLPPNVV